MSENKTAMQLMVEMMDSISRNEPNTMLHNLRKIAINFLEIEKQQHRITWSDAIKAHEERGHNTSRSEADFDEYYTENYERKESN